MHFQPDDGVLECVEVAGNEQQVSQDEESEELYDWNIYHRLLIKFWALFAGQSLGAVDLQEAEA